MFSISQPDLGRFYFEKNCADINWLKMFRSLVCFYRCKNHVVIPDDLRFVGFFSIQMTGV